LKCSQRSSGCQRIGSQTVGGGQIILFLNVAKVGEIQSQGVKGEAVVIYREPLITPDLKFSGFPEG
jgi:hypothetical protein